MKTVVVIDGQGGGCGKAIIEKLTQRRPEDCRILAVGTNSAATSAMLRAGGDAGATGENAIIVNAGSADIIAGPIGIIMANALLGEVTAAMAGAVASSKALRVLVPMTRCHTRIAGVSESNLGRLVEDAVAAILEGLS